MAYRRPFGNSAWSTPYRSKARLVLGSSECAPISLRDLALIADRDPSELIDVDLPLSYEEAGGSYELRAAVAEELANLTPDHVTITSGAGEAVAALASTLTRLGGHVVVQVPSHESVLSSLERTGCELALPPVQADVDELLATVKPDTRAMFLVSPHNPTGRVFRAPELVRLANALDRVGGHLVVDEVYRGVALGEPVQPPVATLAPNGISVSSLSKLYGLPGLRIGWIAGPELVIDDVRALRAYSSRCAWKATEKVALMALECREALLQRTRSLVYDAITEFGALCERHPSIRFTLPDGGIVAFPEVAGVDVDRWCVRLVEERGLLLAPGGACWGLPGRVRLNLGLRRSLWEEALPELDAAFAQLPPIAAGFPS